MRKKEKMIKFYSIYEENFKGDLINLWSCDTLDEVIKWTCTSKSRASVKSMISQKNKIDNKYLVFIDKIKESELI